MSLNSIESAVTETRDGQTYFAYEHLSQVTHLRKLQILPGYCYPQSLHNLQAQRGHPCNHDVFSATLQGSPSISSQTKETYRSALLPSANAMTMITVNALG